MTKKMTILFAIVTLTTITHAQVNLQEMYDLGRKHPTTTLEMFKGDKWGSTFFFVDIYHTDNICPTDFYTEISRSINCWKSTKMKNWNLHIEWNGGCGIYPTSLGFGGYPVSNAWLYGVEYFLHSQDYSKTFTIEIMYKDIRGGDSDIPMQITAVWGVNNLFGVGGLSFSGFADLWWENQVWATGVSTTVTFLTEPQLWYNIGQHFGCDNLNVGGEVEISYNFVGNGKNSDGWAANPCIGLKWNF